MSGPGTHGGIERHMNSIVLWLKGMGIINPSEFFFGIGICIGLPLLTISAVFRIFLHPFDAPGGVGWKHAGLGAVSCVVCCAGLLCVAFVPCLYRPAQVPNWGIWLMLCGDSVAFVGLSTLLTIVIISWRELRQPMGVNERPLCRKLVFALPLCILLPVVVRIYRFLGVH